MLIRDDVLKLADLYEMTELICEFVGEVLNFVDSHDLTEVWVEKYDQPEARIGVSLVKENRVLEMLWAPDIAEFHEILAFLRHRDLNFFRLTSQSIGKVDGIKFIEPDFDNLRELKLMLA